MNMRDGFQREGASLRGLFDEEISPRHPDFGRGWRLHRLGHLLLWQDIGEQRGKIGDPLRVGVAIDSCNALHRENAAASTRCGDHEGLRGRIRRCAIQQCGQRDDRQERIAMKACSGEEGSRIGQRHDAQALA